MSDLQRILIVDDTRIVRATLAKRLTGHYDVREEGDGEAAWQTLVLDHSVVAVISDLQMPVLDGFGLLERVRSCKLARLRDIPFILISGEDGEEILERAKHLGVSDFIAKGIGAVELLTRLEHLIAYSRASNALEESRESQVQDARTGLFTRKYVELQTAQALSHVHRHGGEVSVMVVGFDHYDKLVESIGEEGAEQVGIKLARLLAAKIRREDSLGHFAHGQYAIISPGTPALACTSFANRVLLAVQQSPVVAQGHRLALTMSAGVANSPADEVTSGGALLDLAATRLLEAGVAGGNRVQTGGRIASMSVSNSLGVQQALDLLKAGQEDLLRGQLARLGLLILPLVKALDRQFGFGLPLDRMETVLKDQKGQVQQTPDDHTR
jgi:two-component system, cell cycle response regulator